MVTEDDVRRIALSLPETTERPSYGTPAFRVKDKWFARIREEGDVLVVWCGSEEEKHELIAADPEAFWTTPHYDGHPVVLVRFDAIDAEELTELLTDSWRLRAPRRVLAAYEAARSVITWRRLEERDFPLLREWLERPHVARWWHHETSIEAVTRDFGPAARGEDPSEDLLTFLDGRPLGLVQRCRLGDFPEYLTELSAILDVPADTVSLDYLIGDPGQVGRGLGPQMIRAVVEATWRDHPAAPAILIPVSAANRASWRALEKAGLRRVAEGELEPDNPIDDRAHYLYRIDRPAAP
ncbi:GNAT superfamily N-acetyltransferase [Thermocatellispora tengchongensis]|uniref:GNAT superfamily N-acetyltransferase n=1 Tax=Thermocatellispora tengchongensis TaxID=1073253 RepID=A0A840P9K2_9ACTN|nr:GNAT family N-acetyltransferase [Thermocatellispora tengchongensis]MBB5134531.1 GNAT superfamily N-acetyltransferase [Thermocatellispora tengchongensis]